MTCLFCNQDEKYVGDKHSELVICSSCLMTLSNLTEEQAKELYELCKEKEYTIKLEAIKIIWGEDIERKESEIRSIPDRRSTVRILRTKKAISKPVKKRQRVSMHKRIKNK